MSEGSKDCWECRMTSGGGLITGGGYVLYQGLKLKGYSRPAVGAIGCGLGIIGFLRLFGLPPFKIHASEEKKVSDTEENEYIIGKLPTKFH